MNIKQFDFSNISQNRQVLMGIGILGVLVQHLYDIGFPETQGILQVCLTSITHLVYTEGFLFLSGFGLYHSFIKNSDINGFYKKRVFRLLIPFIIMSAPFFALQAIQKGESVFVFLGHITSAAYWYKGNYCGMWYVAISLLLYFFYPLIHKFIFSKDYIKAVIIRFSIVFFLFFALPMVLKIGVPSYYNVVKYGLTKMPIFVVGMLSGYLSVKQQNLNRMPSVLLMGGGILVVLSLLSDRVSSLMPVWSMFEKFYFIVLLSYLLSFRFLKSSKIMGYIQQPLSWLGQYTLEIYILHLLIYSTLYNSFLNVSFGTTWNIVVSVIVSIMICSPLHKLIQRILSKA